MAKTALVLSLLLFAANLYFHSPWLGGLALIGWIVGCVVRMVSWKLLGDDAFTRVLYGFMIVGSVFVFFLVGSYFIFGTHAWLSLVIAAVVSGGVLVFPTGKVALPHIDWGNRTSLHWLALSILADVFLIALFFFARTDEALVSPWNMFGGEEFFLFFVSTLLLLIASRSRSDDLSVIVGILHTFVAVSVSAIVFAVGFGFDPFVHRAAETAMAALGTIEPRQILYIGQYTLIVALHQLTSLPLKQIDVWLVPVLASVSIPLGAFLGLRDGWKLPERDARTFWILALGIPFMLITFTVPYTATYLFFLVAIFLFPSAKVIPQQATLMLAGLAMVFFHPLLAVPLLVFLLGAFTYPRLGSRMAKRFVFVVTAVGVALSVPAMFVAFQMANGQPVFFSGPVTHLPNFLNLFRSPYTDPYPFIPFFLDALYDFRYVFPMLASLSALVVLVVVRRRIHAIVWPYLALLVGLMFAIFALSTMFYFKDIIAHEQGEFALRLLQAWFAAALPALTLLVAWIARQRRMALVAMVVVSALIVHAWFFSYPQFNLKYPFFSPAVSGADVEAVHAIDERSGGEPYVVLSHQMTSAAALQEFGFASYVPLDGEEVLWYPIPTGGVLYQYYSRTIYDGASQELLTQLQEKTGVQHVYFVVHGYWAWYPGFLQSLEETADSQFSIEEGKITIYEYTF